ncbi:MAG TPA: 3-deoxy-D-manno-octulosonic acid transferase [Terriglobales bacterium]|nr:3-deoxy-D-manno-octulosonic acid transferase [Terriglobales bacterium]
MYFAYTLLLALALLIALPWWLFQMVRSHKYRSGLAERFGWVPERLKRSQSGALVIWVHAVSVGEVLAVSGLIDRLHHSFSRHRVVISTTTASGQKLARDRFGEKNVFYFPLDFGFAIRPFLRVLRPRLVIVAETEFWPNFLRLAKGSGARIAVVNSRVSDRSFPRYRRFQSLLANVLGKVDLFLAQTEVDQGRLVEIGAAAHKIKVSGNLKFDVGPVTEAAIVRTLRGEIARSGAGPVIVCGSTVEGEEPLVLDAFKSVLDRFPHALMILAPRHPERWGLVAEMLQQSGLKFWRRSKWQAGGEKLAGGIFLLDTIGELASAYALAQLAFVGGSLVPRGGHNILEPAQHGVPIIVGPHTENFREIVSLFINSGAVDVVEAEDLGKEFLHLLFQEEKRALMAQHALETTRANTGATERTAAALEQLMGVKPTAQKAAKGRRR